MNNSLSIAVETERPKKSEVIACEYPSGLRKLVLNRPEHLNALDVPTSVTMSNWLQQWDASSEAKLIILTGNGPAFTAGGDLKTLAKRLAKGETKYGTDLIETGYGVQHLAGCIKKPYLALMDGITIGGGVGFALQASIRIATENTIVAMPENVCGHTSDCASSFWIPRLDGQLGVYLGLTGSRLTGTDALYAGIATHYIPSSSLEALEARLDALLAYHEHVDMDAVEAVVEGFVVDKEPQPPFSLGGTIRTAINRCFQYDTMEEIVAALKAEQRHKEWAQSALAKLTKASPTALKISLQLYRTCADLSFDACIKMELRVAILRVSSRKHIQEFLQGAKVVFGTRHKGGRAAWDPPTLEQVSLEAIKQELFADALAKPLPCQLKPCVTGGEYTTVPYDRLRFTLPTLDEIADVVNMIYHDDSNDVFEYFYTKYSTRQGIKTKMQECMKALLSSDMPCSRL